MNRDDSLDFIADIRIAQFWREKLGDTEYGTFDPADLRRWYEAMELRGPDEIRDYVNQRTGRYPSAPVTGIVFVAPHPPVYIVDTWLHSHDKVHTGPAYVGLAAFLILSFFGMTRLNGCANIKTPNLIANIPQPAVLESGQLSGSPTTLATLPQSTAGVPNTSQQIGVEVQMYQPTAPHMQAQQGTAFQGQTGIAPVGAGSTSGASASASSLNGGGSPLSASLGGQSPGPSAYQPGTVASAGMHTANTGSSSHILSGPTSSGPP
jgi:hypothetical protein